jgi:tRNA-(ms[2]io[6]A)-hydroxylase
VLKLREPTDPRWVESVLGDMDAFLVDHAACERKASATAMNFVVRYPDRTEILDPMIALAREELEHFHQVYRLIEARGIRLTPDEKDPYLAGLMPWVRSRGAERFLDRLILGGVVEARGCERFGIVADALDEGELKDFYVEITRSEARHAGLFVRLARIYFDEAEVQSRLESLLDHEAQVVAGLAFRPALH